MSGVGRFILIGYVAAFVGGGICLLVVLLAVGLRFQPEFAGSFLWASVGLFIWGFAFKIAGHLYFNAKEGRHG